ncbi:MAG: hypothetical protein A3B81_02510 [Candidatus Muproteobacteria bacterium RIFCSPHIGHO2_02_FULL_65_16]|uniref:Endolytic murein transglycosylase n=1 Tax=Candidatus Muproteobacteria bacterium RIFCSPHIGHO2_02_FULL_65_16 TaxID=1817766 RepID=A0A1F6U2I6_9PROT|nr:MAG: hypothetical protein A3B81_02510 [Candidatus Muproteobacteria bacterium RIFCSPHIGHO2_02_FULL_65_16]
MPFALPPVVRRLWLAAPALALAAGVYLFWSWNHALNPGPDTFVVSSGTSLRALARELQRRDVLAEAHTFVWLGYLTGHSRDLKAGEYRFRKGISARALLDQVVAGRVVEYPLVLVEGWTFRQFLRALAQAPQLKQTLAGRAPGEVMARLNHPRAHPEGRFYPDTYYYTGGASDLEILARAYAKMDDTLRREWENRDRELPFRSMDEALIMASIVEKETGRADERRQIAGVFINRLRRGMRLQSDPTVIYGLGQAYDGNIRLRDLKKDTPYNTYTRAGLPPTPIAMPGGEALNAVLHPADTRALYFVSRGDGSHEFSNTLEEHNKAVIKYQLKGRRQNFSSFSGAGRGGQAP